MLLVFAFALGGKWLDVVYYKIGTSYEQVL